MLIFADRLLLKLQCVPSTETRGTVSELIFASNKPGGAEAELAALNYHGIIDAVLTSDSDTLIFGAQVLLRM